MRNIVILFAIALFAGHSANATITTPWTGDASGAFLYDSLGSVLTPGSLRIELVVDLGAATVFTEFLGGEIGLTGDAHGWVVGASAATDVIVDSTLWLDAGEDLGYFNQVNSALLDSYAAQPFYFRWFDASTEAGATEAGIIYGTSGWNIGGAPPAPTEPAVSLDYTDIGSSGSALLSGGANGAGWQTVAAVPEPGSMGLLALGLVTLVARKRKRA